MRKRHEWTLNTLIYGLWLLFVLGTAVYTDFCEVELHRLTGRMWLAAGFSAALAPLILKAVRAWKPRTRSIGDPLSPWLFRGICFGCSLLILGFCFLAVNPGGFEGDPASQMEQVLSGNYNDYYPAAHTFLALWLPMALTGGWFPSVILFQILLFSAALTYLCDTVRRYANTLWALVSLAVILLNPITQSYLMYGYKDETFGICAMMLACMNARIYFSRGKWLKNPFRLAAFAALLAVISLVRHNGFLFAIPCAGGAALCVSHRRAAALAGAALVIFAGVRGPLYSAVGVQKGEDHSSQTMGLPMSVIGGAVKYRPERLDGDLLAFAYEVAPKEVWEENYTWGVYNWVDWDPRTHKEVVAQAGFAQVLGRMAAAIREAPKETLKALVETTSIAYGIFPDHLVDGGVYLGQQNLGLEDHGIPWMREVMDQYRRLMYFLAPHSFLHSGVTILLLLTVLLARHSLLRKESWLRIVPVLSLLCYNLVTMLVLYSWWDGARFFHYSIWVAPALLVLLTGRREEKGTAAEPRGAE